MSKKKKTIRKQMAVRNVVEDREKRTNILYVDANCVNTLPLFSLTLKMLVWSAKSWGHDPLTF